MVISSRPGNPWARREEITAVRRARLISERCRVRAAPGIVCSAGRGRADDQARRMRRIFGGSGTG